MIGVVLFRGHSTGVPICPCLSAQCLAIHSLLIEVSVLIHEIDCVLREDKLSPRIWLQGVRLESRTWLSIQYLIIDVKLVQGVWWAWLSNLDVPILNVIDLFVVLREQLVR